MERESASSRIANGLMSSGFLITSLSAGNLVRLFYDSYFSEFDIFYSIAIGAGVVMIAAGVTLLLKREAPREPAIKV